ncbi:cob(I)yrinic acid a,c-diamide adenosyltransferase [Candidatus Woesearchaeota archaeon]|nr:cob(I)yrinic acid a,c-diamide adenosyltransferase [Candidatus Woesearchaeota archaeon]
MLTRIKKLITVKGDDRKSSLGLVHVYTGQGKGKTTATLGLAMRALGAGLNVCMIQFMKSADTGELFTVKNHLPEMKIIQFGVEALTDKQSRIFEFENGIKKENNSSASFRFMPDDAEKEACRRAMEYAWNVIRSENYNMLILDEVNCALDKGLIKIDEIMKMVKDHDNIELVLTGQGAPRELVKVADYFSDIRKIKHPWDKGVKARRGIEY